MIANGCRDLNLKMTATGCVLFAVLTFTRYTDLFVSLLTPSKANTMQKGRRGKR